jgi:hypothetical protein
MAQSGHFILHRKCLAGHGNAPQKMLRVAKEIDVSD